MCQLIYMFGHRGNLKYIFSSNSLMSGMSPTRMVFKPIWQCIYMTTVLHHSWEHFVERLCKPFSSVSMTE